MTFAEVDHDGVGNYPTAAAANAVLRGLERRGLTADPMKLQKLLYFVHGYYLAVTDNPWIDEQFEVWEYGPVVPSLYYEFRENGSAQIDAGKRVSVLSPGRQSYSEEIPNDATEHDETGARILSFVLEKYGAKSAIYLSDITHKVGSPWYKVREEHSGKIPRNTPIPNDEIRNYFLGLIGNGRSG